MECTLATVGKAVVPGQIPVFAQSHVAQQFRSRAWFADLLAIYAIAIGSAVSPAMGIFQYITKPCHPDNRLLIVRNACRLYQLQRENELLALEMKVTAPNLSSGCRGWGCATISRFTRSIQYCTRQGSRETGIGDPIDPVALCRG